MSLTGDGYKLEALMIELLENMAASAAQSVVSLFLFLLLLIMVFGTLLMKADWQKTYRTILFDFQGAYSLFICLLSLHSLVFFISYFLY